METSPIQIGKDRLTIEGLVRAAKGQGKILLCGSKEFEAKIDEGAAFLDRTLAEHGGIYGVTTGYGDSCTEIVTPEHYYDLPVRLTRYHGCGLGAYFDKETTRAIMIVRLNTLAQGFSGVSMDLLRYIAFFIEQDILPLIPEEGSVGASGDLTPLSYLAGALIGERDVLYQDKIRPAADVLKELGKPPYRFRPKEAIAIMNGTAVMNAVAALAFDGARYLADLSCRITAMNSVAIKGNAYHFYKRLFEVKPHPGQAEAARRIRESLKEQSEEDRLRGIVPERIQDPYSLRCAPHVIGVFYDAEDMLRRLIETEMNSANDNPIVDPETRSVYHGGHFYGGHICFAMDALKNISANIADLMDRQLALMVDIKFNRGLPPNLSGSKESFAYNHGFKAVQIAASAWTAEALKNTMPASVFSRSTECHNQDKVSMGTIAARDCIRVNELTAQTLAAALLAAAQALYLRLRQGELSSEAMRGVERTYNEVLSYFAPLEDDRPLDTDLRKTVALIEEAFFSV
ncbi:HAL/PAL/TAL family ammonia-lyase [Treponema primitia]|uniref:HAL/PAL/TAL family ammonia-lyase n=1 Tax=Treponema primitia TaxID=88058 RepID=UPI0002554CC4|nr:aromatic amino acid ammonia-lyase [Treponema primitia]